MATLHLAGRAKPHPPLAKLTFFSARAGCGFPSPAADEAGETLDFNTLLVRRPAATYALRVAGDSMRGAGIQDGDTIVCDRSLPARPGDIVVAVLDGSLIVKRLGTVGGKPALISEPAPEDARSHPPLPIPEDGQFEVWGRVTAAIHRF